MKKINTSPISGTQELLPAEQIIFDNLKTKIAHTYKTHGFSNIETPCLERSEILLAKAGGDTEKQIYEVKKTGDKDIKNFSQALRFDHTVPLARFITEHESNLIFPLKAYQIGLNFRGERAQKGRFREFYQCDIDIIGRGTLPIFCDVDIISTLLEALSSFDLATPITARISNRKILSGLLEALELSDRSTEINNIVDHSEKVTPEQTKDNLEEIKLTKNQIKTLLTFIDLHGERSAIIKSLNNLEINNPTFNAGVTELDQVLGLLESIGLKDQITADLKIVRGLDYYTGTVFEFILPEYKNIGAIAGGGRYDNLTSYFSDQTFPGVGGSIGLTRLYYVLAEHNLLNSTNQNLTEYALIPVSDQEIEYAFRLAAELRSKNHSVTIVLNDKKFNDKIAYAAKIAANGIVIGESEVESGKLQVKDFATGKTRNFSFTTEDFLESSTDPTDFWTDPAEPSTFL
ncbi:MAG: histidine--tRNA ligase [Candidatus Saccharibacteria bacterium]|nr:histidine--tRNA ligase [Candidatus Saccharibacteria bacterium]